MVVSGNHLITLGLPQNQILAQTQNITIGISFGLEQKVAFEHAKTKTVVLLPLLNS